MGGIDFLTNARTELLEGDGEDRERFRTAAKLFRFAVLVGRPTWPRNRRSEADILRRTLGTDDDVDGAVDRMDEAAMRAACDALWRFCDAAWAGEFAQAEGSAARRPAVEADIAWVSASGENHLPAGDFGPWAVAAAG